MIKQLIKYLWKTYGPRRSGREKQCVIFTALEMAQTIITFADLLEKDGLCQTIAVPKNSWADVNRNDPKGGISKTEYGPCRIIIIKEYSNGN